MRHIVRVTALTLVAALVTVMVPSAPAAGAPGDTVGTITEFDFPTPGGSASVAPGPDGNMWFTKGSANQIGRITVPRDQGGSGAKVAGPSRRSRSPRRAANRPTSWPDLTAPSGSPSSGPARSDAST